MKTLILLALLFATILLNAQVEELYEMSLEELMNMEIESVSKVTESSFDAILGSSVVTQTQILNSGATSIMEALRLAPGVIVREQTNGNYDIHLRGMDYLPFASGLSTSANSITLVMIDNRVVFRDFLGGTFWETLPIDINDVEQIEIVRGPSSALYGPNAVAGVINIITKREDRDGVHFFADQNYGDFNTMSTKANFSVRKGKMSAQVTGNYQQRDRYSTSYYDYVRKDYTTTPDSILSPYGGYAFDGMVGEDTESQHRYPHPENSIDKFGVNTYLQYELSEDVLLDLSAGAQESEVQKIYVDNQNTPFTTEKSQSYYTNINAEAYGAELRASYLSGTQNTLGISGWEFDFQNMDVTLEYELNLLDEKLGIRPGVNYRSVFYDDKKSQQTFGYGFINGRKELNNFGSFIRLDYRPLDNLRIVGAVRAEKYNYPDDIYVSYQLAASYKINSENIIRASASKANKGANIVDTHQDFSVANGFINYAGNKNLNLMSMQTFELGYRSKIAENLQIDIETYYSLADNFSYGAVQDSGSFMTGGIYLSAKNIECQAEQMGAGIKIKYFANNNLELSPFVNIQQTELQDYDLFKSIANTDSLVNIDHKWTPSYYGGVYINYNMNKFNVNINPYFYGKQKFNYGGGYIAEIEAGFIVNTTLSYSFYENGELYLTARNLFANSKPQFAFADPIMPLVLTGIRINL